jgi:Holliday junction DNA helicase RuvA
LRQRDLKSACILCGGVGYQVQMPLGQLAALGDQGASVEVHVHTHLREGAIELFGFADEKTLGLFERLLSVTGVGPKSAIGILSGLDPDELVQAVVAGDEKRLTRAPGVGKKTAARIILELRDKLKIEGIAPRAPPGKSSGGVLDDLKSALENLGYKPAQVDRALADAGPLVDDGAALEELVRQALKRL